MELKILTREALAAYLAQDSKEDGEVIGLDSTLYPDREPYTVHYSAEECDPYVSGDSISEWGFHNLNPAEAARCGVDSEAVRIAEEYYFRTGSGITLAELAAEMDKIPESTMVR